VPSTPRFQRLYLHLWKDIVWLFAKRQPAWDFIVRWKKSAFALLGCVSALVTWYSLFVTALSIAPGEPRTSNPFSAPFVITNQRSLMPLMEVLPDCDLHYVELKNQPGLHMQNNNVGHYRKPIPVLAPLEQTTVYCGREGRPPVDAGPLSLADVTISVEYKSPYIPCHGMKWQRFMTYVDSEGKLKWKPAAFSDDPVPKSVFNRRRFYCW
jgi:hypothetical protein